MNRKIFFVCALLLISLYSSRGVSQTYTSSIECNYEKPNGNRDEDTVFKIPVVFHVVVPPAHTGNAFEYIAPNKIYDCLNILNMIYEGASPFDTININTNIKFFPATIDIYGDSLYVNYQCERYFGITYDFCDDLSEYEDININRNGHTVTYPYSWEEASNCDNDYYNAFPQDKYLNVWIFNEVGRYNGMGGSADWDGYACGFVALPKKVVGTNNEVGRELGYGIAHEVGHYFGLSHPWPNYGVPFIPISDVYSHTREMYICDTIDIRYDNEPVSCNNIMEYTPDGCRNGFSQGQKDHMRAVINSRFSELTDCENYIYQGSRLSMFSTEIVSPVENIICNEANYLLINLPDTAIFKGLKIYRDNEIVASFLMQDTISATSTSLLFQYPFDAEGSYELSVYCGGSEKNK